MAGKEKGGCKVGSFDVLMYLLHRKWIGYENAAARAQLVVEL